MADETFWLARGACVACGRPVAQRAAGPGPVVARCNVCHTRTQLEAGRVMLTPQGVVPAPVETVERTPVPDAAPSRASWRWIVVGLLALAVVFAAAAVASFVRAP
jgi:hypothetical protein